MMEESRGGNYDHLLAGQSPVKARPSNARGKRNTSPKNIAGSPKGKSTAVALKIDTQTTIINEPSIQPASVDEPLRIKREEVRES